MPLSRMHSLSRNLSDRHLSSNSVLLHDKGMLQEPSDLSRYVLVSPKTCIQADFCSGLTLRLTIYWISDRHLSSNFVLLHDQGMQQEPSDLSR